MMNLHYGLIHVGLPTMVDLAKDKLPNIKEDNMPTNFELCKEGDVAFADASEDTNEVAKTIEFYNLAEKNVVCGLHTIHGRDNKHKTVVGFKGYTFSSTVFHNQIRRIAQGTKIYSISTKNFSECYIGLPSKPEQTKIATLLRLIDERVATQNKIIEALKLLRDAISGLIFNSMKNEKTILLGNVACISNGSGDVQDSDSIKRDGWYPFFDRSEEQKWFPTYSFNREAIIYAGEGQNFFPRYYKGKFALHQRCYAITDFCECLLPKYCLYFMNTLNSYFIRNAVGSTVPSLRMDMFQKAKIKIPTIERQQEIVSTLDALSLKCENEEIVRALYNTQKSYLLQQLFI
ncbi:MAG: restriction endonuclease subunit S [Butyricimonas virosa]|uniref:restriction endonuclease subunit S n=1 Tax=Butyricimonas virosa TaxID=544645 RepID=UPI00242FE8B5|nr:restriction endonuclease subunit S [Butyricimonas virosa]MCI7294587.1 restriction endonuclease subunit S [Butyricimonas virosa]